MTSRDYYRSLLQLLATTTVVMSQWIECDEQDIYAAYLKGSLDLIDGSKLFFAQYVRIEGPGRDQNLPREVSLSLASPHRRNPLSMG